MSTQEKPLRNPYFGELHVHTAWSLDAFVLAALNGPETGKPQCCHSRGSSALSPVPSCSVVMMAA